MLFRRAPEFRLGPDFREEFLRFTVTGDGVGAGTRPIFRGLGVGSGATGFSDAGETAAEKDAAENTAVSVITIRFLVVRFIFFYGF